MTTPRHKLEEDILVLFERACRLRELAVAEHLLRALEVATEAKDPDGLADDSGALADAYRAVARMRPYRRRSR